MNQGKISTALSVQRGSQQPLSVSRSPAGTEGASLHSLKHSRGGRCPPQRGWALGTPGSSPRLSLAPQEMHSPSTASQALCPLPKGAAGSCQGALPAPGAPESTLAPAHRMGQSILRSRRPDTSLSRRKRGHHFCNYFFLFLIRQIKREGKREN